MAKKITVSIAIPVFNEEHTIEELWRRLSAVLEGFEQSWEVVFVDDGSSDRTPDLLSGIAQTSDAVRVIRLSRNFGHGSALTAGIDYVTGDAVILMDGDLQDKPEAIPSLLERWEQGDEVVYAIRSSRDENSLMRLAFKCFYRFISRVSGIHQPLDAGIFCLLDRKVVDLLKSMPERNRYFPGLRAYAGFKQTGIEVERDERFAGQPRVGFIGLIKLAVDGIIAFSYIPIRLVTLAGVLVAFSAFGYVLIILYKKIVSHEAILGWASTLIAILFLGGVQLITLGLLGEYIGRIYEEVKKRPYYIVAERTNFDD